MKIYITRHGETKWNKEGRMQGWSNSDLTEKGVENAKKLGKSLENIDFDCIYCSPLGRAIDTANYIRGDKDTKIIIEEAFKEMGFGSWEGVEHDKVEEMYPNERFNFWNKPQLYKPVDGETFEELLSRVKRGLESIVSKLEDKNILIVSHSVVIKAIYAIVKKTPLDEFWNPPFMKDTCLSIIEVKDNEMNFILEADISHLD